MLVLGITSMLAGLGLTLLPNLAVAGGVTAGADVTALEKVDFVMRRGVVHKDGGKRQPFPPE